MNSLRRLSRIGITTFLMLAAMTLSLVAQNNLKTPERLEAYFNPYIDYSGVELSWMMDDIKPDNGTIFPVSFKIYMADAHISSTAGFDHVATLAIDSTMDGHKGFYQYFLNVEDKGEYSFFVTAVYNNNQESGPSNIAHAKLFNEEYIYFTSIPERFAKKNVLYSYELVAESSDDEDEITITPLEMPTGATFDALTNKVNWTPTQSGQYLFNFKAEGSNSDAVGYHQWYAYINKCDVGAIVQGTVKDKKGNLMDNGWVYLYSYYAFDSVHTMPVDLYYETQIANGEYKFENVDEGEYWVMAAGENFFYGKDREPERISVTCNTTKTFDIEVVKYHEYEKFYFTSTPSETAKKNVQYTYQPTVETESDDPIEFALEMAPQGATIDKTTGLITWTPTASGVYDFHLTAKFEGDDSHYFQGNMQYWQVIVTECDVPSIMVVDFKYTDGKPVMHASAMLFSGKYNVVKDSMNYTYPRIISSYTDENGKAYFNSLDKGEYYLMIESYTNDCYYHQVWYDDANSIDDATPINVLCNDTIFITMTIEAPKPVEYFNVSGTVYRQKTNEPLANAFVELIPVEYNCLLDKRVYYAITNNTGDYTIEVPNNTTYIARAEFFDGYGAVNDFILLPQFFDGVSNYSDATPIKVEDDVEGIDFNLKDLTVYANSISGTITDETDFPIEDAHVVAFKVDNNNNSEDNWFGHSSLTNSVGGYTLKNLIPGEYVVFAMTDKRFECFPGYYKQGESSTWNWEDATRIVVGETSTINNIDIQLGKNKKLVGSGKIIGFVGNDDGKVTIGGENNKAVNGATVYAANEAGTIFTGTFSAMTGEFEIPSLPNGTYSVMVDKIGFKGYTTGLEITDDATVVSTYVPLQPVVISSVDDDNELVSASVFPNPVRENINLTFSGTNGSAKIVVVNSLGIEVYSATTNASTGLNSYQFSASALATGSYYAKISNNGSTVVVPFVVNK